MIFSVVVSSPPDSPVAYAALQFSQAIYQQQSSIYRLFFIEEGVLNALKTQAICPQWDTLIQQHKIDATCCINSAKVHELDQTHLMSKHFSLAGLGQLIDATVQSDRVIIFGARG